MRGPLALPPLGSIGERMGHKLIQAVRGFQRRAGRAKVAGRRTQVPLSQRDRIVVFADVGLERGAMFGRHMEPIECPRSSQCRSVARAGACKAPFKKKQERATCSLAAVAIEQGGEGPRGRRQARSHRGQERDSRGPSLVGSQDRKDRTTATLPGPGANREHNNRPITIRPASSIRQTRRAVVVNGCSR